MTIHPSNLETHAGWEIVTGISAVIHRYDAFLVDAWGVLHDGRGPYPGVLACLETLRARAKSVVVISNAARRHGAFREELAVAGIDDGMYRTAVCSGELAWSALRFRSDPRYAALGKKAYFLGPPRSAHLRDGLDIQWMDAVDDADFVLVTGVPEGSLINVAPLMPLLQNMARLRLPMVCANPDECAIRGGELGISAGAIARTYRSLGAQPVYFHGKPDPEIFRAALDGLAATPDRVLVIGDALATDIRGAADAGIDALLIAGGIHRDELLPLTRERLAVMTATAGPRPRYVCEGLRW